MAEEPTEPGDGTIAEAPAPAPARTTGSGRRWWVLGGLLIVLAVAAVLLAQRDDGSDSVQADTAGEPDAPGGKGEVTIQLEQTDAVYIEGFEIGLRFEDGDGKTLASTLWTDFVQSQTTTPEGPSLDEYYNAVLRQPVPVGTVVVRAQQSIGAGPPPETPDLQGTMDCAFAAEVEPGETIALEFHFEAGSDCFRQLPDPTTQTTVDTSTQSTSSSSIAPPVTTTTSPADVVGTGPAPTTTVAPSSVDLELAIGVGVYVDVDLDCRAFALGGIWVVVDGDPRSWQPEGERHEGGTFTLDTPTTGTFRGDEAGTKVATFRLLGPDEPPACQPVPR